MENGRRKLTSREAIMAGALGAVIIIIRFVLMVVGGISPYVWFSTHFIDAILIGPVFMLMVAKTGKNGAFFLTSLVTGLVLLVATWMLLVTCILGGLLSEFCLRRGKFKNKAWIMLGYICFNLGFIGDFLPLWITKTQFLESASKQMSAGYIQIMQNMVSAPVFFAILASIVIGSLLGGFFGMKLMKKHFIKAGLV